MFGCSLTPPPPPMRYHLRVSYSETGREVSSRVIRRGLTLVEVVCLLSIVLLLIALLLPALGKARASMRVAGCLANIKSSVTELAQFAGRHRERMPALRLHDGPMSLREPRGRVACATGWLDSPYFGSGRWWSWLLSADLGEASFSWTCPQTSRTPGEDAMFGTDPGSWLACAGDVPPSSYSYSAAFTATPAFWQEDAASQTLDKLQAQQLVGVTFPSAKVVLFEGITAHRTGVGLRTWDMPAPTSTVAFSDLHAAELDFRKAFSGVPNRFNVGPTPSMLNTRDGILGRDY